MWSGVSDTEWCRGGDGVKVCWFEAIHRNSPFTSMVKYLGLRSRTLKGPLYGGCSDIRAPSCRMNC